MTLVKYAHLLSNCFWAFCGLLQEGNLTKNDSTLQMGISRVSIVSQLDKCLKFRSVRRGDENDCTSYKITPRNAINFRHLSSCGTIDAAHCKFIHLMMKKRKLSPSTNQKDLSKGSRTTQLNDAK